MQEAITLTVFCAFSVLVLREKLTWNYYVGFGLVLAGVFFVFHFQSQPVGLPNPTAANMMPSGQETHS
jgi:drug/metabolite transporter (DMT)-like permease